MYICYYKGSVKAHLLLFALLALAPLVGIGEIRACVVGMEAK